MTEPDNLRGLCNGEKTVIVHNRRKLLPNSLAMMESGEADIAKNAAGNNAPCAVIFYKGTGIFPIVLSP